nr:MAG TPA_asm: Vascular endothelial growth factor [Caudoviricetes sp.]
MHLLLKLGSFAIKLHQKRCRCEKPRSFNDFRAFLRPFLEA